MGRGVALGAGSHAQAHAFFAAAGLADGLAEQTLTTTSRGQVSVHTQTLAGVPIEGTHATALVTGGEVRFAQHRLVDPTIEVDTQPSKTAQQAVQAAQAADPSIVIWSTNEPTLAIAFAPPDGRPTLAWRVPVADRISGFSSLDYVDAHSGAVFGRQATSVNVVTGVVRAPVEPSCQGDTPEPMPMPFVTWGSGASADAAGRFASAASPTSAQIALSSPYFLASIAGGLRIPGPYTAPLTANGSENQILLSADVLQVLDSYVSFHRARQWLASHAGINDRQRRWAGTQVSVFLNIQQACNAFYNQQNRSLNFFAASSRCVNTATSPTVVTHEYGHSVAFASGNSGRFTLAVSEGLADTYAILVLPAFNGPGGLGKGCAGYLRTCVNRFSYCDSGCTFDSNTEGHVAGQAICGVWYDLRQALGKRYGQDLGAAVANNLFLEHLALIAGDMPDTYSAVLAVDDDDDGDASNGTLHSCEINNAFNNRSAGGFAHFPGLANMVPSTPSLAIAHDPPGHVAAAAGPLTLRATLTPQPLCSPNPKLQDVVVRYQVDNEAAWRQVAMVPAADGGYAATLADVVAPATVRYVIAATLDGAAFLYPPQVGISAAKGAMPTYVQALRYSDEDTLFASDFEDNDGSLSASSDAADSRSAWTWGTPTSLAADPWRAHSKAKSWGINQDTSGDPTGVGGRTSRLTLPAIDASHMRSVQLSFFRAMVAPGPIEIAVNGAVVEKRPKPAASWRDPVWTFDTVDLSAAAAGKASVVVSLAMQAAEAGPAGPMPTAWSIDTLRVAGTSIFPTSSDGGSSPEAGNAAAFGGDGGATFSFAPTSSSGCAGLPAEVGFLATPAILLLARAARRR